MRYIVDVGQHQADRIAELVNEGKYQSVAQFILAAIENQIYIEGSPDVKLTYENKEDGFSSTVAGKYETKFNTQENDIISVKNIKGGPQIVPAPKFSDLVASTYNMEEERCWLWGQSNKIFPVKIGLRVLYKLLGSEQWIDLDDYREKAALIASSFGTKIRLYEKRNHRTRDERISAGLPMEKEFKSIHRYKNHFLAYMRKDEKLDGPMPFLKFVNLKKTERGRVVIGLTEYGASFARIENPIVDAGSFEKSFGDKEIEFYLEHITKNVRGECFAFKWVLTRVRDGISNGDSLNKSLSEEMKSFWKGVTPAVVNTQRAGLMARMFELGLLNKKKQGVAVTYVVSKSGQKFLA